VDQAMQRLPFRSIGGVVHCIAVGLVVSEDNCNSL
jgi:hypothetical protein